MPVKALITSKSTMDNSLKSTFTIFLHPFYFKPELIDISNLSSGLIDKPSVKLHFLQQQPVIGVHKVETAQLTLTAAQFLWSL
jgi:hypothetical protein